MKKITTLCLFVVIAVSVNAQHPCIVADYPFNGDASDVSGNNYHGVEMNGVALTTDRFNNANSAYLFDGTDDYIELNGNLPIITTTEFTISAWAYMNGLGGGPNNNNTIFSQRDDDASVNAKSTINLETETNGEAKFSARGSINTNGVGSTVAVTSLAYNAWHHYAATLDAQKVMSIYIDGQFIDSTMYQNSGDFVTSIDHVVIGTHYYSNQLKGLFNGKIDNVQIFDCALDSVEIDSIYNYVPIGINEKELNDRITIYPNPTEGKFRVESLELGVEKVEVYDLFGRLVLSSTTPQIDMRGYAKGMYFVQVGEAVRKLVIE